MTVTNAGLAVEINMRVQNQSYKVEVMETVPKPTVVFRPLVCSHNSESCSLTCNGDARSVTGIVCRHSPVILVAEWLNNDFEFYSPFKGAGPEQPLESWLFRTLFRAADAGLYTVEINAQRPESNYKVEVMKKDPITDTLWKRDGNLVAEWLNDEFEFYGAFNGRITLNTTTGELVVQNMTWLNNDFEFYSTFNSRTTLNTTTGGLFVQNMAVADAGLYTVGINSNVQISVSCSLTCDGDTKAGTVTYSWRRAVESGEQGKG
ncbi:pregnancy-specific beta-1-glycoprotein 1-like protein [Lates japonicus]|uniref:Pregnancy-specific beta-1-glycoprotein 1-like protein n=1 Tax=Lates japonicus TaxID=270547 RepID=A0AAD3NAU3_LATJO|nr:pregnancy-specific beta-1-glycoprotein 1-like protein [Lates japonicus]